jgi:predicted nuclease of predicted toxin-antitoxin system
VKLLIDENVGIEVYLKLKQKGLDVVSAINSMKGASDEEIILKAINENRVIVTSDKEFGWLAFLYKPPGVILLRLKNEKADNKVRVVLYVIEKYRETIFGSILVVSENRIRIRKL